MSGSVQTELLHHSAGAGEAVWPVWSDQEVPGGAGPLLWLLCLPLCLLRDGGAGGGGQEADGWAGAGREEGLGGLLHHQWATHFHQETQQGEVQQEGEEVQREGQVRR